MRISSSRWLCFTHTHTQLKTHSHWMHTVRKSARAGGAGEGRSWRSALYTWNLLGIMGVNLLGFPFHRTRCGSSEADGVWANGHRGWKNPDLFNSRSWGSVSQKSVLKFSSACSFYKEMGSHGGGSAGFSVCIPSCPLPSVTGCVNPTLHSPVRSCSPLHHCFKLTFRTRKIRRSGVSGENCPACWVKRIYEELSSRAERNQKDMTLDPWPNLWSDMYRGQLASWPGISLFCSTILYRVTQTLHTDEG